MTASPHPPSYYAATAVGMAEHPPLTDYIEADVCIIGGGYTGLSAALHLAERGYRAVLLEANRIGWGASGRNGGQVYASQRKSQSELETAYGEETAKALYDLGLESFELVKALIQAHAIDCGFKPGILHAAWKPSHFDDLRREAEHLRSAYGNEKLEIVGPDEIGDRVATSRYHGGVLDRGAGHLHPLNFALGLARAATEKGAALYEGSRAIAIEPGPTIRIRTAKGSVRAGHAVLALNGYLGKLEPRLAGSIMPINNFIAVTEPLGEERARALIRDDVAVADTKFVIDYYRLTADHRLLFGGGETYSSRFPSDIGAFVRRPMTAVFPQLAGVPIDYAWGGTLAITLKRMPHFGRLEPNLYFAHGYSGQGINIATLAGQLLAEAIAGTAERFDLMASLKPRKFPGGALLRYPGLVLGMLYYALRDRL